MSTVPEAVGRRPAAPAANLPSPQAARHRLGERAREAWLSLRWPLTVFLASRLLYLAIALLDTRLRGWRLGWELSNWDGFWYLLLVRTGYPTQVLHTQSTLGFLPLYPLLLAGLQQALSLPAVLAGMVVSTLSGAAATVLVGRLAHDWWGAAAGRRATLFFCLFPGSIVFSMLYTEGLLIALVAGCLLALERRRWLLAGVLAGVSTAVGPVAVAIIPACAVAAGLEWRRQGRRWRAARRALLAPLLAPAGIVAFGAYLWLHTGDPLASYTAQHDGWQESSTPLALVHTASHFVTQVANAPDLQQPGINLNYPVGLLGALFMAFGLVWMLRARVRIPLPAIVWTLGIALLTVTSANVPPNPRMLIVAFPLLGIYAARWRGAAFARLLAVSAGLLVVMSLITYVGTGLRP